MTEEVGTFPNLHWLLCFQKLITISRTRAHTYTPMHICVYNISSDSLSDENNIKFCFYSTIKFKEYCHFSGVQIFSQNAFIV